MQVFVGGEGMRLEGSPECRGGFMMTAHGAEAERHLGVRFPSVVRVLEVTLEVRKRPVVLFGLAQPSPAIVQLTRRHLFVHARFSVMVASRIDSRSVGAKIRPSVPRMLAQKSN